MIKLCDLSGREFVLNSQLIEMVEEIPETKITLTTGKYFLVGTSMREIIDKVVDFNRRIYGADREIRIKKEEINNEIMDD
ncbi:MAG: flagellar FlbD family protein [Oscillospiraceae bacterium]